MASRRRGPTLAVVALVLAAAAFLVYRLGGLPGPLAVTVRNDSPTTLQGLTLVSGTGIRTAVPDVPASDSVTVRPGVGQGEDVLSLVDGQGRRYLILGYFEGNPGGTVLIAVESATADGLAGRIDDRNNYFSSGESRLQLEAP